MTKLDADKTDRGFLQNMIRKCVLKDVGGPGYKLGEAIIITCCEHVIRDFCVFSPDSVIFAVNSGATQLVPVSESESYAASAVHRFLIQQISTVAKLRPELPIVLVTDFQCKFLRDGYISLVDQLDYMIRGMCALKELGHNNVSCMLRATGAICPIFFSVNDTKWDGWYQFYEAKVLYRQDDGDPGAADDSVPAEMYDGLGGAQDDKPYHNGNEDDLERGRRDVRKK
ncbi:hypothetical protein HY771_00675 [Candidatus Uhrbacteria bacterium]|nr:hypothetical protein [Candidatus Uhrbacteria bacterium]